VSFQGSTLGHGGNKLPGGIWGGGLYPGCPGGDNKNVFPNGTPGHKNKECFIGTGGVGGPRWFLACGPIKRKKFEIRERGGQGAGGKIIHAKKTENSLCFSGGWSFFFLWTSWNVRTRGGPKGKSSGGGTFSKAERALGGNPGRGHAGGAPTKDCFQGGKGGGGKPRS